MQVFATTLDIVSTSTLIYLENNKYIAKNLCYFNPILFVVAPTQPSTKCELGVSISSKPTGIGAKLIPEKTAVFEFGDKILYFNDPCIIGTFNVQGTFLLRLKPLLLSGDSEIILTLTAVYSNSKQLNISINFRVYCNNTFTKYLTAFAPIRFSGKVTILDSSNKSKESDNEDTPEYTQYPVVRGIRNNAAIHDFELSQAKMSNDKEQIIFMLSSATSDQTEQIYTSLFAWMRETFLMVHQLCEHDLPLLQRLDRELWDFHTLINPREPLPFSQVNVENN